MILLTIIKGLLPIVFVVGALGFLITVPATIITLLIGIISKEYKYFKSSLKAFGLTVVVLLGSVLLYAIILFLKKVFVG